MTQERMIETVFAKQSDAIQQVIRRTCIIDYGIVLGVLGQNVVKVGLSVADNNEDVQIIVCTLISACSSSIAINVVPKKGDKVIVFFPRHFNPNMFDVNKEEPIVDSSCKGYTRLSGLAMLANQFNPTAHKNTITVDNGAVTIESAKTKIEIDKDGNVSIDTEGKYTIKNNDTDLLSVIKGLSSELKNLTTTATSQTSQATSAESVASLETWEHTKLEKLLSDGTSES